MAVPTVTHEPRKDDVGMSAQFTIPLELRQLLLNIFKDALGLVDQADLHLVVQEVKGHLFNRDFKSAFGKEIFLEAYAGRWSPSRALAYIEIFNSPEMHVLWDREKSTVTAAPKVVFVGGGAGAELVALAGLLRLRALNNISVVAVDVADWSQIVNKLEQTITLPPPLSRYASAEKQAANSPLVDCGVLNVDFKHHDILDAPEPEVRLLLSDASLITLMFTLNELFSTSMGKTTSMLLTMTDLVASGTMLLVVDSPGSYSEVSLGKDKRLKRYPMAWLLDHVLIDMTRPSPEESGGWEKLVGNGSNWFRVSDKLRYPMPLESMRYQMHLFRRL